MQNNLASIETFKCDAITGQRTPSTQLVLRAQPQERETPIPEVYVPMEHDLREHRKRYDAAISASPEKIFFRAILFIVVLVIFAGWAFSLYLNWRLQ